MIEPEDEETQRYIENTQVGRGRTLDEAIKDAYVKLEGRNTTPPYRIAEIWADGTNPFSGFRVVIRNE